MTTEKADVLLIEMHIFKFNDFKRVIGQHLYKRV